VLISHHAHFVFFEKDTINSLSLVYLQKRKFKYLENPEGATERVESMVYMSLHCPSPTFAMAINRDPLLPADVYLIEALTSSAK